jgi:hypothetical protein
VLKPETSSDSPSAKSTGARFSSAKIEKIHTIKIITIKRFWYKDKEKTKELNEKVFILTKKKNKIMANETS